MNAIKLTEEELRSLMAITGTPLPNFGCYVGVWYRTNVWGDIATVALFWLFTASNKSYLDTYFIPSSKVEAFVQATLAIGGNVLWEIPDITQMKELVR